MAEGKQVTRGGAGDGSAEEFVLLVSKLLELAVNETRGVLDCYVAFRLALQSLEGSLPAEIIEEANEWLSPFGQVPPNVIGDMAKNIIARRKPPNVPPKEKQKELCDAALGALRAISSVPKNPIDMLGALHLAQRIVFASFKADQLSEELFDVRMLFLALQRGLEGVTLDVDIVHIPTSALSKGGDA